jgi:hypothetical protein
MKFIDENGNIIVELELYSNFQELVKSGETEITNMGIICHI